MYNDDILKSKPRSLGITIKNVYEKEISKSETVPVIGVI